MEKNQLQKFITLYLKYGSTAKPLKNIAFSQLSLKALFLENQSLSSDEVRKKVAELIMVKQVSKDLIERALEDLEKEKIVKSEKGKYLLTKKMLKEIKGAAQLSEKHMRWVLERHFPKKIDKEILRKWFSEVSANFFGYYSAEWLESICKSPGRRFFKPKTISEILLPIIKKYKLTIQQSNLIEGFLSFLTSEDGSDQQYLVSLGLAMFHARLVAAGIGVDPIALNEIKDSTFILDTNFLISMNLESRKIARSLKALGSALKFINSTLVYIDQTKKEYEKAVGGKREEILELIHVYPKGVIEEADDDFIRSAIERKCKNETDIRNFFSDIIKLPNSLIEGLNISLMSNKEIEEEVGKAIKDEKLKNFIQSQWMQSKAYQMGWKGKKSEAVLNHDSVLIHVAELTRRHGEKCFILSLDKSLQACSVDYAGPHGTPTVLLVSALIHILAIHNAGPELVSSDFAPLLSSIILNRCMPPENTYRITDLRWLQSVNERVLDLPPESIKEFAKLIARERMKGVTPSDPKLQLAVNRMFQDKKIKFSQQIMKARDRIQAAEQEAQRERDLRKKREKQLTIMEQREIEKQAFWKFIKGLVPRFIFIIIISVFIFFWLREEIFKEIKYGELAFGIIDLIFLLVWIYEPWKEYRRVIKDSFEIAERRIK